MEHPPRPPSEQPASIPRSPVSRILFKPTPLPYSSRGVLMPLMPVFLAVNFVWWRQTNGNGGRRHVEERNGGWFRSGGRNGFDTDTHTCTGVPALPARTANLFGKVRVVESSNERSLAMVKAFATSAELESEILKI
uniref:(northern house mosquito) hypothetical protein n=1 Tax=Culex pipiens TaxID=7175 RepID=A0A8D8A575_CULPI